MRDEELQEQELSWLVKRPQLGVYVDYRFPPFLRLPLLCLEYHMCNRVEWFLETKLDTCHVVPNCSRAESPEFHFEMLLFNFVQGIRKCWLHVYPIKWAKQNFVKRFWACSKGGIPSLDFLELKMTRNSYFFYLSPPPHPPSLPTTMSTNSRFAPYGDSIPLWQQ